MQEITIDNEIYFDAMKIALAGYSGCTITQAEKILDIPGVFPAMKESLNEATLDVVQGIFAERRDEQEITQ